MGFVLLGLMTLSTIGLSGAVLQMFSHGIIAGLLFAVVGRMVYERTHTRVLDELEAMRLNKALPFAAVTFVVAGLASMGMPGFSGFVAEFQVLIGAWRTWPTFAVLSGVGILIGVAYTLRVVGKAFFSETDEKIGTKGWERPAPARLVPAEHRAEQEPGSPLAVRETEKVSTALEPITIPERIGAVMLIAATLLIGLYPRLLLDLIVPALQSPLFDQLRHSLGP